MTVLIASIDGPDLSGKTTVSNLLVELLKREITTNRVIIKKTELPTNNLITGTLTDILRVSKEDISPEEFALAYALDHLHYYKLIIKPLELSPNNYLVVQERSLLTTIVYQGLIGGVNIKWLEEINKYCKAHPDITYILKVPLEELLKRKELESRGIDIYESKSMLRKQSEIFYNLPLTLIKKFSVKYIDVTVDAFKTAETIKEDIVRKLNDIQWI